MPNEFGSFPFQTSVKVLPPSVDSYRPGAFAPGSFRVVLHLNPIYYMIESMRFALIGQNVERPWAGFAVIAGISGVLVIWALWLLRRGYKLRA